MVVHLIPNTLSRVLTPLHTAQRVIIRNEPAGLACHLRVYREQLNDAPAIRADLFGVRGLPWQPLSIERNPSTAGQRPAAAFLVFFLVLLYIMIA